MCAAGVCINTQDLHAAQIDLTPKFEMMGDAIVNTAPGSTTLITRIDKSGKVTHETYTVPESEELIRARKKFSEGAETYTLTVKSSADKNGNHAAPGNVYVMKDTYMYWKADNQEVSTFELPAGVYNIQVLYNDEDHSSVYFSNVELNSAKEVEVNADMADKYVSFEMIMPDGSPLTLPDANNADFLFNTIQIAVHQSVLVNGCSQWTHSITSGNGGAEAYKNFTMKSNFGENTLCYWNALSWKTTFGNIGFSVTKDGATVTNGERVKNNVEDFYQIGAKFNRTPLYAEKGAENTVIQMSMNLYRADNNILSGFGLNITDPTNFYVCAPKLNNNTLYSLAYMQSYDVYPKYGRKLGVYTPAIANTENGLMYLCNQSENPLYNIGAKAWREKAPFDYDFSYPFNPEYVMCSTTPYASTAAVEAIEGETPYYQYSVGTYYGNYGENRFQDASYYTEEATYNGEAVDLSKFRNANAWLASIATDETHVDGKISLTYINTNAVTGEMDAKNECTLSYTEGTEDMVPPTLQRMMLSNADGVPTILFAKPENATIAIAAGDFKPVVNMVNFGDYTDKIVTYDYSPVTAKIEVAPTGSEEYAEVEVTQDAEKYLQSYGAFWSGSLKEVAAYSETGWFDLKVTLTDAAGNTQVQKLAPAFYIESSMEESGVDKVSQTPNAVKFNVVNGCVVSTDGKSVMVYDMTGAQVQNKNLSKGIYLVVSGAAKSKIMVK